jgi:hypothetical protein
MHAYHINQTFNANIDCTARAHEDRGDVTDTGVMEWGEDDNEINGADDERIVGIAMDSGAVDHTIGIHDLPGTAEITALTGNRVGKNLVAANGSPLTMHGECSLMMEAEDGTCAGSLTVTDVTRTLQSVSKTCDQDLGVFFTKMDGKVLDAETVAAVEQLIKSRMSGVKARYPRSGGLYVRRTKLRSYRPGVPQQRTTPTPQPRPPQQRPPSRPRQPQRPPQPQRPQQPQRPRQPQPPQQMQRIRNDHNNGSLLDFTRQGAKR